MDFRTQDGLCFGKIYLDQNGSSVTIDGYCGLSSLSYIAASPATALYSRSGSGLPWPNPEVAYEGTPIKGTLNGGSFRLNIPIPNSYYVENGSVLIRPHVIIMAGDQKYTVPVHGGIEGRSLSGLPGNQKRSVKK